MTKLTPGEANLVRAALAVLEANPDYEHEAVVEALSTALEEDDTRGPMALADAAIEILETC